MQLIDVEIMKFVF